MNEQDDIQQDIDSAAENQQMEEARRHKAQDPDVKFWAGIHDDVLARQRVEMAKAKALDFALRRIFGE